MEQDSLSAYTEKPLDTKIHIDHFRKRNLFQAQTFDYANFLVDDLNDNYGARYKDNQAHVNAATFTGPTSIFCPVTEDMSEFITFNVNGFMFPKTGLSDAFAARVKETIRVFHLNHPTLVGRRRGLIIQIKIYKKSGLTANEIRQCVAAMGFPSVVNWALSNL